jgi:hypothetical protein
MTDNLYIFVVSQEQKEAYQKALEGKTYKDILIRPVPEFYKCFKFISECFPEGQQILLLEDKTRMYSLESKDKINLKHWVEDGFKTALENKIGAFTFSGQTSFRPNTLFLKGKPFKEIGFYPAFASVSGFINHRDLWELQEYHKYQCDSIIWLRYFHRYGGILKYNYIFYTAKWFKTKGGLSSVSEERKSTTDCDRIISSDDISIYIKGIVIKNEFPAFTYKTNPQVKKIHPLYKKLSFTQ